MCGCGHPAGEIGFEGLFVVIAGVVFFADVFHDAVWEEVECDGVENVLGAIRPDWVAGLFLVNFV